jgi:hypothetical protein
MVSDSHAYVFPEVYTLSGYDSMEQKWAADQIELGGHHQSVWRVRYRAPADKDGGLYRYHCRHHTRASLAQLHEPRSGWHLRRRDRNEMILLPV